VRVTMDRDALADAVAWTTRVLPGRPALPVLAGVLLDAGADTVQLSCFDYEVSARCDTIGQVSEPGQILVPGKLLADIARTLPAADVSLESDGGKLRVRCGSTRFALPVMPVEDYPQLPAAPASIGTVAADVFASAVAQVATAAARDETPPVLTSIKVDIDGDRITMVATDRYRLSLREFTWRPDTVSPPSSFLVRARTLADIAKAAGGGGVVTLGMTEGGTLLGVTAAGRRTTVPTMDGEYPPVRKLFPTTSETTVIISTAALVEGVRRVALVGDRSPVRLSFTSEEVTLESGTGEDASARDSVPVTLEGPELSIAFNAQYLLDGLAVAHSPHVKLAFTEPSKPALLTGHSEPDGSDDRGFTYLIMPIRIAT